MVTIPCMDDDTIEDIRRLGVALSAGAITQREHDRQLERLRSRPHGTATGRGLRRLQILAAHGEDVDAALAQMIREGLA